MSNATASSRSPSDRDSGFVYDAVHPASWPAPVDDTKSKIDDDVEIAALLDHLALERRMVDEDDVSLRSGDASQDAFEDGCTKRIEEVEDEVTSGIPIRRGIGSNQAQVSTALGGIRIRVEILAGDLEERGGYLDPDDGQKRTSRGEQHHPAHPRADIDEGRPLDRPRDRIEQGLGLRDGRRLVMRGELDVAPNSFRIELA